MQYIINRLRSAAVTSHLEVPVSSHVKFHSLEFSSELNLCDLHTIALTIDGMVCLNRDMSISIWFSQLVVIRNFVVTYVCG